MTNDYGRAIGRIEGKLDRLLQDITKFETQQHKLFQSMELIKNKCNEGENEVETLSARFEKVEKPFLDFMRWRERFTGAIMLASFVAASLGGTVAVSWQKLLTVIKTGL